MIFPEHAFTSYNAISQNEEPELGKYDFAYNKTLESWNSGRDISIPLFNGLCRFKLIEVFIKIVKYT